MSLTRQFSIRAEQQDDRQDGDDLVLELSFASEEPYVRWWGVEVLDCSEGSVRLERINDGGALLFNHDWDALRGHHVPGSVRCEAGKVRGNVAVSWAADDGKTIKLIQGGHLTKTSTGYEIHQIIEQTTTKSGEKISRTLDGQLFDRVLTRCQREAPGDLVAFRRALDAAAGAFERAKDEPTTYRVTDWEILENSLVTVPADTTVGLGRSLASDQPPATPETNESIKEIITMDQEVKTVDVAAIERAAHDKANKRYADIDAMAEQFKDFEGVRELAAAALRDASVSAEAFQASLLKHISEKGKKWAPEIGMEQKEAARFSLMRALNAMATGDWSKAGLEREASDAVAKKLQESGIQRNGTDKGFLVPLEVQRRDLVVGTATAGGNAVATNLRPQDFVELLRARQLSAELGVRRLTGLVGNADITRQTGAATAYWVGENSAGTESQQTLGLLQLRPKGLVAYTEVGRLLRQQMTPDADMFVMDDLAKQLAIAIDAAVFAGTGLSNQPTGVLSTSGIGSVTGTSLDWAKVLEFQTDVAAANALNRNCKYVTTPAVAALLAQRQKFSSTDTPLWVGNILDGQVGGFPAHTSTNIPSATMLFGDFSEVVQAEWGVLEIDVNPYANFAAGTIGIRAFHYVDIGVRTAGAFSAASSIT